MRHMLLVVTPFLAALAGCSDTKNATAPTGPTAEVRVVQAVSDLPGGHVRVNGATRYSNMAHGQRQPAAGYDLMGAGTADFALVASAGGTSHFAGSRSLVANERHTVIAVGAIGGTGATAPTIITLRDTAATPSGTAWFRFLNGTHSSPNAGANVSPVDIYVYLSTAAIPTTPTRAGLTFASASAYLPFVTGTYTVRIYGAGANPATATPLSTSTFTINNGQTRTFVALDKPTTTGTSARSILVLADRN